MFSTRTRETKNAFECVLVYDVSDSSKGCCLDHCYPVDYPHEPFTKRVREFVFPCKHRSTISEEYALVFTDIDGKLEFVVCLFLPMSGYLLCVRSFLPMFEFFHSLLLLVSRKQLNTNTSWDEFDSHLQRLRNLEQTSSSAMTLTAPISNEDHYPFVYRYILEYYAALSISNWIIIFEGLLMENSIIFHSTRFQRVTSCVLASLSLIYPLVWAHLIYPLLPASCIDYIGCPSPFIAGLHSCMVEKAKAVANPGVLLVDLDNDSVYMTSGLRQTCLPDVIRQWLLERCCASNKAVLRRSDSILNPCSASAVQLTEPYLTTMAILLGGYRTAMRQLPQDSVSPAPATGLVSLIKQSTQPQPGSWVFVRDTFIASRGRGYSSYLHDLLQSQMVLEFLDSRLRMLNSDAGIIPSDAFEDCVARVHSRIGVSISPRLLRVSSKRFPRFQMKKPINLTGIKSSTFHMSPICCHTANTPPFDVYTAVTPELKDVSSLSSSSSTDSVESVGNNRTLRAETPDQPTMRRVENATRGPVPHSDAQDSWQTRESRRSLMTSILGAIPDIPENWLTSFPTTSTALSKPTGEVTMNAADSASKEIPNDLHDVLHAFDPYCPKLRLQTPVTAVSDVDELSSFLRQLDPLNTPADKGDFF